MNQLWLCGKSESDRYEIQNLNMTASDFSWRHHILTQTFNTKNVK